MDSSQMARLIRLRIENMTDVPQHWELRRKGAECTLMAGVVLQRTLESEYRVFRGSVTGIVRVTVAEPMSPWRQRLRRWMGYPPRPGLFEWAAPDSSHDFLAPMPDDLYVTPKDGLLVEYTWLPPSDAQSSPRSM